MSASNQETAVSPNFSRKIKTKKSFARRLLETLALAWVAAVLMKSLGTQTGVCVKVPNRMGRGWGVGCL